LRAVCTVLAQGVEVLVSIDGQGLMLAEKASLRYDIIEH
jgi:hypothetical protein